MRRKLAIAAAVTVVVLGVLVTRAVWEGRAALDDGDRAAARGDFAAAIDRWRAAARWYVPLAPHVDDAYARLERIALEAEAQHDDPTALAAWRAIRSSSLATRWIVTPHADRRARAERRIAALQAAQPTGTGGAASPDAGDTHADREAFYLGQLQADGAPSVPAVVLALVGFALWIGGCVHFARRGLDPEGRLVRRAAASAGGMVLVGMLVWIVGLHGI